MTVGTVATFSQASRGRLTDHDLDRFSGETLFDRIARGDIFYYELVVPEGKNMFDIGALAEQLGLFPAERFLAAARDPSMIRDLDPEHPAPAPAGTGPARQRTELHAVPARPGRWGAGLRPQESRSKE